MTAGTRTSLVMGASGFLGSHVTRQLVARGDDVHVWLRPSSSTVAIADLDVARHVGALDDASALRAAMAGVGTVFYCIVDTRAWSRDGRALWDTNVGGLRKALEAAVDAGVSRFVFCSTVGTMARRKRGPVDETAPHNWKHLGGDYIASRVAAEELVLGYGRDHGLPVVVLNVSMTYGPADHGPTPHGRLVRAASKGQVPAAVSAAMEVVGVEDAARAFLLADDRGRAGERYIISERFLDTAEVFRIVADEAGVPPPRIGIAVPILTVAAAVVGLLARLRGKDSYLTPVSVRLMHVMTELDHSKATRELGWVPRPTEESIRAATRWFIEQRAQRRRGPSG